MADESAAAAAQAALEAAELEFLEQRSALTGVEADADERVIESALRPRTLDEVIGQERVREQLALLLEAARRRERVPDHVLLSGPPGLVPRKSLMLSLVSDGTTNSAAAGFAVPVSLVVSSFAQEVWMSPVRNTTSFVWCARSVSTTRSRSAL